MGKTIKLKLDNSIPKDRTKKQIIKACRERKVLLLREYKHVPENDLWLYAFWKTSNREATKEERKILFAEKNRIKKIAKKTAKTTDKYTAELLLNTIKLGFTKIIIKDNQVMYE